MRADAKHCAKLPVSQPARLRRPRTGGLGGIERIDVNGDIEIFAFRNLRGDEFGALVMDILGGEKCRLSAFAGLDPFRRIEQTANAYMGYAGDMLQLGDAAPF